MPYFIFTDKKPPIYGGLVGVVLGVFSRIPQSYTRVAERRIILTNATSFLNYASAVAVTVTRAVTLAPTSPTCVINLTIRHLVPS
jgi:hypothetical protein